MTRSLGVAALGAKRATMSCRACNGRGWIHLPEYLQEVLDSLRKQPMTARELSARLAAESGVTAMNNRLEFLRALGLVRREWFTGAGRGNHGWRYAVEPTTGAPR